jgi:hypothetical protein
VSAVRVGRAGALAVAVAVTIAGAACAHPVAFDPWRTTLDVQQAASEAGNDLGLHLYYGYECEIDGNPHDQTRFTVDCATTTGDGRETTMVGEGQADSNRHYHGTFTIEVDRKPVATLHCLGNVEAPRC